MVNNPIINKVRELDDYNRGSAQFTTTELIEPERILALAQVHAKEISREPSVWSVMGSALHAVLREAAALVNQSETEPERFICESRFEATLPGGTTISSQIDVYDTKLKILDNYKVCSVWKFILGDSPEWEQQLNVEAYVLRANGFEVRKVRNVAFLRDWNARKARVTKEQNYPQSDIHEVEMPLWSAGQQQDFILERISRHVDAARRGDKELPLCSKKERWQRDASYAVMKKGRKSAIRLFMNHDQAWAALRMMEQRANPGEKFYLEERAAEPVRCLNFCPVAQWCDFGIEAAKKFELKST